MHRLAADEARRQFLAYVEAVFSLPSADAIAEEMRQLSAPSPFRVRVKALYSGGPAAQVLNDMVIDGSLRRLSTDGPGYVHHARRGGSFERSIFFAVLPTSQPSVSAVVSVAEREEWQLLLRAIRKQYPLLVPIYLSQRELLDAVAALRRRVAQTYEVRVRELSAKETLDRGDRQAKSVREWTDEEWEKTVGHLAERHQVVTSVSFAFHRRIANSVDPIPSVLCKVAKRGEIDLSGRFDVLWSSVVSHVADVGERKLAFYSKRGLREAEYASRPLAIRYTTPVFDDIAEVRRLVEVLEGYPRSMHTVTHGNPYAFVQVADTYDGSSFDVWAVSPGVITVVPRLKATPAAVDRLIQYIFDEFKEGVVENYVAE